MPSLPHPSFAPLSESLAAAFRAENWALWRALGTASVESIHPIGSHPGPEPTALPRVEVLAVAESLAAVEARTEALRALGYVACDAEPDTEGPVFQKGDTSCTYRLRCVAHANRPAWRDLLALRAMAECAPETCADEASAWSRAVADAATLSVARPTPEEAEALAALWERSVRATHGFLTEEDVLAYRPMVLGALQADEIRCLLLRSGGRPLGFLLTSGGTHIEALFLEPTFTGLGLGARLLSQALANGAVSIDVNEDNPRALRLYEAFGFRQTARAPKDPFGRPYPILSLALPTAPTAR